MDNNNNNLRYPETKNDLSYNSFLDNILKNPEEKENIDYKRLSFVEKVLLEQEKNTKELPGRKL